MLALNNIYIYMSSGKKRGVPLFFLQKKEEYPFFRKFFLIDSNRFQCPESEKLYPHWKIQFLCWDNRVSRFSEKKGKLPFFEKKFWSILIEFNVLSLKKLPPWKIPFQCWDSMFSRFSGKKGEYPFFRKNFSIGPTRLQCTESEKL